LGGALGLVGSAVELHLDVSGRAPKSLLDLAARGFGHAFHVITIRALPLHATAHSLVFLPYFPPAAERCAFTCVESIIRVSADRPFPALGDQRSLIPRNRSG
jgi:hypothetical protein